MTSKTGNRTPNKTCDYCGEGFYISPSANAQIKSPHRFCSVEHRSLYLHQPNTKCAVCQVPLWRSNYELEHRQGIFFCSREHQAIGQSADSSVPLNSGPVSRDPETRKAHHERRQGLIAKCRFCPAERAISKLTNGCCNRCVYIDRWLRGEESGTSRKTNEPSSLVIRYMKTLRGEKCWECGWCEVNSLTGRIPVQVDHIDGNSSNNHISNLRVLCPNHHSLTPTFGNNGGRTGQSARIHRYSKIKLDMPADTMLV